MTQYQTKASEILFYLVAGFDSRLKPLAGWFQETVSILDKWHRSEGNQGVKRMKDILQYGWQVILGEDPEPLMFVKQVDGTPSLVRPLVDRVKRYPKDARLLSGVLSLVRVTDLFQGQELDATIRNSLEVINDSRLPNTARSVIDEFSEFVTLFCSQYPNSPFVRALTRPVTITDRHFQVYRESIGPNGPLTANAHRDLLSLTESACETGESLYDAVVRLEQSLCDLSTSAVRPSTALRTAMESWEGARTIKHSDTPGKLSFIPEKSGKVRTIAQPDYWSQLALQPLHDHLNGVLRSVPSDCTFDQRSAIPMIAAWQQGGKEIYSFDQSSCTDLFPFDFQLQVLSRCMSQDLSEAVKTVMVDREWKASLPKGKTRLVRWSVGQPMGIMSSWPLMAVSHHLLVQFANWISNGRTFGKSKSFYTRYAICGDDIVIADKSVADAYLALVKRLGMRVNLSKSHISGGATGVEPVSEFAKITVWKGQPLFPIRPNMVLSACRSWRNAVPLLIDLARYSGFKPKKGILERMIRVYFPEGKRFLTQFLTLPQEFGGCGYRDDESMWKKFHTVDAKQIHPWLYYLGLKIRSGLLREQKSMNPQPITEEATMPRSVWQELPLVEWQRAQNNSFGTAHLYGDMVPSVEEICLDLLDGGFERYSRFLTEDSQVANPDWLSEIEKDRILKQQVSMWEKALMPSKQRSHKLPELPERCQLPFGFYNIGKCSYSAVADASAHVQMSTVQRAMLATRVKQDHQKW